MKSLYQKFKWLLPHFKSVLLFIILIIIFSSGYSLASVYRAYVSKSLIDSAITGNSKIIIKWVCILGLLLTTDIIFKSINSILSTYTSGKLSNSIQKKLYKHLMYTKWNEHSKYHSVNLMTRITSDVDTITSLLVSTVPSIISLLVMLVSSFCVLLYFEPTMAFISIGIFPVSILISKICGSKIKKYYIALQNQEIKYRSFMQETIQNITIVKGFATEDSNIEKIHSIQQEKLKLMLKRNNIGVASNVFLQIGSWLGYFCVFGWGALNLSSGSGSFGTLTALLQLFGNIQGPFSGLSHCFPQIVNSLGAIERLMEIESFPIEDVRLSTNPNSYIAPSINFNNISFSYNNKDNIIKDFNLSISPGEIVGLIGPSGEGKTTIIRLLLNLIEPSKGNIIISEKGQFEILNREHRKLMAYVPQGNTLFSGTIKKNITYGDNTANYLELYKACEKAQAIDFINPLESKFESLIGEGGKGVSEGQAQRLAIARAFIKNKPILILDEATSALDQETEVRVLENIKRLDNNPICIIITHRPKALEICDKIINLKNGTPEIIKDTYSQAQNS